MKGKRLIVSLLIVLVAFAMMPLSAFAFSEDQDPAYIENNVLAIADKIDDHGSVDDEGYYYIEKQSESHLVTIKHKGDSLEFVMGYDFSSSKNYDSFITMLVSIPTKGKYDLKVEITDPDMLLKASATLEPSDYVLFDRNIDFKRNSGDFKASDVDYNGNILMEAAYMLWDELMTEEIGMPVTSLGFWKECEHVWTDKIKREKATCTEEGKKIYTCKYCGIEAYKTTPAKGHDYDSGKVTKKADIGTKGKIIYTCKNDSSHTKTKSIAALKLTIKASKSSFSVKAKNLKKKAQSIKDPITVKGAKTKVTYSMVSGNSKFKVDEATGKITIKKGTKKGTYKIKVKVTTASSKKYEETNTTVTVKIKVK